MRKRYQKAVDIDRSRIMRLEDPGKEFGYGIPAAILKDLSSAYSIDRFLADGAGDPEAFGEKGMEAVIAAVKNSGDRTWEMMTKVSQQTGIVFPHHVQYLVESYLLATRSSLQCTVGESTMRSLRIHVEGCPCAGKEGVSCEGICRAALARACREYNLPTMISVRKSAICEYRVSPAS